MRKTAQRLLTEYGTAAVVVYFTIFFTVLFASRVAIGAGWHPTGALASVGAWTAAYLFTKVTQPIRLGATAVLTPLAARGWERVTGRPRTATLPPESPVESPVASAIDPVDPVA